VQLQTLQEISHRQKTFESLTGELDATNRKKSEIDLFFDILDCQVSKLLTRSLFR